ncbi:MAG: deoxyribodipyrimidine photo-lyase [Pseudomonadota bacterium]
MNDSVTAAPVIYWYRQDLRLADLPGLSEAAQSASVLPCYVHDHSAPHDWALGGASRWWLHHSLDQLASDIAGHGGQLVLLQGETCRVLCGLVRASGAKEVHASHAAEPWARSLQRELAGSLRQLGARLVLHNGSLLFRPSEIRTQSGGPFKVFTPFWRRCRGHTAPAEPDGISKHLKFFGGDVEGVDIDALGLLPSNPNWATGWESHWQPGSEGADSAMQQFISKALSGYAEDRNIPSVQGTSRLSPHLHFGELSPNRLWHTITALARAQPEQEGQAEKFLSELGWREFSYHLLYHFPTLTESAFKPEFDRFPWLGSAELLQAWQRGQTGYPIVDAGMRELWATGYMHNRVRMIVASFLTKHLLIDWRSGARWFWDTLVDADLANNTCSWQWVAGSGADAAPYFRIFNPTLQGKKFDASGAYVRRWVPELEALPKKYVHEPATAPTSVLEEAGVRLGENYPQPIVDHAAARQSALDAYQSIRD